MNQQRDSYSHLSSIYLIDVEFQRFQLIDTRR